MVKFTKIRDAFKLTINKAADNEMLKYVYKIGTLTQLNVVIVIYLLFQIEILKPVRRKDCPKSKKILMYLIE